MTKVKLGFEKPNLNLLNFSQAIVRSCFRLRHLNWRLVKLHFINLCHLKLSCLKIDFIDLREVNQSCVSLCFMNYGFMKVRLTHLKHCDQSFVNLIPVILIPAIHVKMKLILIITETCFPQQHFSSLINSNLLFYQIKYVRLKPSNHPQIKNTLTMRILNFVLYNLLLLL